MEKLVGKSTTMQNLIPAFSTMGNKILLLGRNLKADSPECYWKS
ncbi:MAG: hypothetical protein RBR63_12345 [Methanosarcina vacuolata]|nr:hypothetical protein [Methanosarcina vacuolata]